MGFRHADRRFPFLWEGAGQSGGRWNAPDERPVQYFADTPDGAWAEFLRHEEINSADDLATIDRAMWAVELPDDGYAHPRLPKRVVTGGVESYERCRTESRRVAQSGAMGLVATSAALLPGGASGWNVAGGLRTAAPRDGRTIVLFGERPDLIGWRAGFGRPGADLLPKVRQL